MWRMGESNWISLFLCGTFAVLVSWMTSGCFIGDYVQYASTQSSNPDSISGFYLTQPQSLTYSVMTANKQTQQATAPLSWLPSDISSTMTQPVALLMQNLQSGAADLTSSSGEFPLPVQVGSSLSLSSSWSTTPQTFWNDSQCQSYQEVTGSGQVTQNSTLPPPSGFSQSISGKLQIQLTVTTQFQGTCAPTFQALSACYQDSTQCEGISASANLKVQTAVIGMFSPWVQLNLLSAQTIPEIANYSYQVQYQ